VFDSWQWASRPTYGARSGASSSVRPAHLCGVAQESPLPKNGTLASSNARRKGAKDKIRASRCYERCSAPGTMYASTAAYATTDGSESRLAAATQV
jgi:hypothetical protein